MLVEDDYVHMSMMPQLKTTIESNWDIHLEPIGVNGIQLVLGHPTSHSN